MCNTRYAVTTHRETTPISINVRRKQRKTAFNFALLCCGAMHAVDARCANTRAIDVATQCPEMRSMQRYSAAARRVWLLVA
eukprot:9466202-Lingulodinium_polyedra.AAC.1